MQVGDVDVVVVDHDDGADAGRDQCGHDEAAEPAGAEHHDARVGESTLRVDAPAGEHALAGVAGRVGIDRGHAPILAGAAASAAAVALIRGCG